MDNPIVPDWAKPRLGLLSYAWALPNTIVALLLAILLFPTGARMALKAGVVEVHGGMVTVILGRVMRVCAATLGHVVFGLNEEELDYWRPHERIHVRQNEQWGFIWLPCYLLSSLWAMLTGGHYYMDNWFEKKAYSVWPPR